jgi:hypothetical protein
MAFAIISCKKEKPVAEEPQLIFKFKFDSTQERLNNIGQLSTIPSGHAAQSPKFNGMSAHYIELAPTMFTALGAGKVLYKAPETNAGGDNAIDFSKAVIAKDGESFFSMPLKNVGAGTYEWLRVSLAYQNYDVKVRHNNIDFTGTIASFIGFNTYIKSFKPKTVTVDVNANKLQGYWAFEAFGVVTQGQAPAGATTVVNPIFSTSPIPAGSCVVTGSFNTPLVITGNEKKDIVVTVSLSTNKSFEWIDTNNDGIYEPAIGDAVVDMGIRGMKPILN